MDTFSLHHTNLTFADGLSDDMDDKSTQNGFGPKGIGSVHPGIDLAMTPRSDASLVIKNLSYK